MVDKYAQMPPPDPNSSWSQTISHILSSIFSIYYTPLIGFISTTHTTTTVSPTFNFTMHSVSIISLLAAVPAAMACLGYEGGVPTATGEKTLSEPQYIGAGETFDAGWVKYDRGEACSGQSEGGKSLASHRIFEQ